MPSLRLTLALLLSGCVATPDLVYAPDDAGDAHLSDAAHARAAPPPPSCLAKDARCSTPSDCCSGQCKLKGNEARCDD